MVSLKKRNIEKPEIAKFDDKDTEEKVVNKKRPWRQAVRHRAKRLKREAEGVTDG